MSRNDYITCRELIDFIADYLDGCLTPEFRQEFDRHLSACPSCVAYLDGYKKTIALGKSALMPSDEPATGQVPEGLLHAIRAARRQAKQEG
ncbi:MAG: anti-sigma factor family protein [Phycisphaerales bacterium]